MNLSPAGAKPGVGGPGPVSVGGQYRGRERASPRSEACAVRPRPIFGFANKETSDSAAPKFRFDEPAFKITDVIGVTIFDERANARFEKSAESAAAQVCH